MQKSYFMLFLLLGLSFQHTLAQKNTTKAQYKAAEKLLNQSIQYHDPSGLWKNGQFTLHLEETRPNRSSRYSQIQIDNESQIFTLNRQVDKDKMTWKSHGDTCTLNLNGQSNISEADKKEKRLTCHYARVYRDYYTYLWGMPMKLKDPGTIIDPNVKIRNFYGDNLYEIKVTYEAEVGADIWYFYFDPTTSALRGYRFYHDESKNDGEYILLEGEETVDGLRLPKRRAWYYHQDGKFLGADILQQP